ncbi:MAG: hypothetical protein QOF76_3235 [Solirubrobacteraceae bacterium]|jgi:hypothetical protein|nr:hypothetical protein [Solirubrobacteraceae bacterium]
MTIDCLRPSRIHAAVVAVALTLPPAALAGTGLHTHHALRPTAVTADARSASRRVIVVMRDQVAAAPASRQHAQARIAAEARADTAVISSLQRSGGRVIRRYRALNGFAATISTAQRERLAHDPAVAMIVPDSFIRSAPADTEHTVAGDAPSPPNTRPQQGVCPSDPSRPLLEPEALQTSHTAYRDPSVPQAQNLATGHGVKVAFLADGLDIDNPDFIRPDGSHVFVDYQDFTGDGPSGPTGGGEAFGDASAIAAQGRKVYDLSQYVNPAHPLPAGCTITVRGVAPGAQLIGVKAMTGAGGYLSVYMQALDYAVSHDHADVLNESFGDQAGELPDTAQHLLRQFNEQAVAAGVVVVEASGDAGSKASPEPAASDPAVIDAGATTTLRLLEQIGSGGAQFGSGGWLSSNVASFSSAGFTQGARTVDLVAGGQLGWALCTADPAIYGECFSYAGRPSDLLAFGGTSEAAPEIAGAAALVIEAYRRTHGGHSPAPALVERLLTSTATDLGEPGALQGAGELNALAAVQAAQSVADANGAPPPTGHGLLVSPGQTSFVGTAGSTPPEQTVTITNVGTGTQTVRAHVRRLIRTTSNQTGTLHLTATDLPFADSNGGPRVAQRVTVNVPARADTLHGTIAWPEGPDGSAIVRLSLLDPDGNLAANAVPQGYTGHDAVDVAHPTPGQWTALVYTRPDTIPDAVQYQFTTQRFDDVDAVRPSALRLAPGQSGDVHLRPTLPRGAGDTSADLVLDANDGGASVVPLVLRSLVRLGGAGGTFTGDLVGGNGRAYAPTQVDTFEFDVPPDQAGLGVRVRFEGAPAGTELWGFLIDPTGEALASHSTSVYDNNRLMDTNALQVNLAAPRAGRWRFVLAAISVSGGSLSTPYTGTVTLGAPKATIAGVPDSARTVIKAGTGRTATVSVRNDGPAPELLFLDPRLAERLTYPLLTLDVDQNLALPMRGSAPTYLMPSQTDAVDFAAQATAPVTAVLQFEWGAPTVGSVSSGNSAAGHFAGDELAPGQWFIDAALLGPFPAPVGGSANTGLTAHTRAFDREATTSTGDIWLEVIDSDSPGDTAITVAPHASGSMTITFSPTGPPGRVVRGTLYVDDFDPWLGAGNDILAIPYAYTVG